MDLNLTTLPNGLAVVSIHLPAFRGAAVGAWIKVGSRDEPAGLTGISHLLEHMAFKGTERRDARRIAFEAEMVGANMNAYTAKDHTAYYMTLLAEHAGVALDVIGDVLRHSTFPPEELERERDVILQEIAETADDPQDLAHDAFDARAFPEQPLGRPIIGTPKSVRAIPRDALVDWMSTRYVARNMVVAGVGGIDHARFLGLAAERFGDLPAGEPVAREPARYDGGFRHVEGDFEQTAIALGWPIPGRADPRHAAFELLAELFGGGMSSPLFQAVRERRGLSYSVDAWTDSQDDCGVLQVGAGVAPKNLSAFFRVVGDELEALTARIDPDDLARARNQHRANLLMTQERPLALAENVARELFLHGRVPSPDEAVARMEAVDETALRQAVASVLAGRPTLAIAGRAGRGDHHGALVRRFGPA